MKFKHITTSIAALALLCACKPTHHEPQSFVLDVPQTVPDYLGVTFAPNIAAPSFTILGDAEDYQTEIGRKGQQPAIIIHSDEDGEVEVPLKPWAKLLEESKGDSIYFRFAMRADDDAPWLGVKTDVMAYVSPAPIDGYLVYRLIYPGYELWSTLGIYQRNLSNYEQTPIVENRDFEQQCVNCHNFAANSPAKGMMLHVRGLPEYGGTIISSGSTVEKLNSRFVGANHGATYPSFSRDGNFIAYSANSVGQLFHTSGAKPIEVVDVAADMLVYDVANHQAYSDSVLTGAEYIETFPNWSPDGHTIYFCRAKGYDVAHDNPATVLYDLCAIDFDPVTHEFDNLRVLYAASEEGKSVTVPRVSPDGRWLMFCRMNYGTFAVWHPEAQLCLMNLADYSWREMNEVNSNSIDSYHSWSSDGKWFVFSSKRLDGNWARPYLAAFNTETGLASKPFVLPQKKADFYDEFTRTYNIPELITEPVSNADVLIQTIQTQKPREIQLLP